MKKIAIVSSYDEGCGNAYFTKVLVDSLNNADTQVECIGLNLKLTQSVISGVRKKANKHIDEICSKLKCYDGVNIQLEAGLYGTIPKDIICRLKKLALANKNTSITLHSPRLMPDASANREMIKLFLKLRLFSALKLYMNSKITGIPLQINYNLIKFFAKNNINLIVHTERAKEQIKLFFDYDKVAVHPLKIVPSNTVIDSTVLDKIRSKYNFTERDVIIGMFGFINEYKGHSLALDAMELLPQNYKLLFFGRQHPQTLKTNTLVDKYLYKLQNDILKSKRLKNRVYFMGEYATPDFINLAGSVDFCWLPYVENGQDGSGIASICLDVSNRVMLSSSFAFDELLRIEPLRNGYNRFDIGNAIELADKTKFNDVIYNDSKLLTCYSVDTQAELYRSLTLS
ncbi:hypothetical protein [Plesiomonas shigelloides]|uniref:hypothetical protein n=1 Tax=Plesiomonas shigelloides TaxID=703 RepID=UPI00057AE856|nr:hypothetical protein [Plesiomonas shigelloides]